MNILSVRKFITAFSLLLPIFLAIALIIPRFTSAASYTWDGGGATNNWSECTNWSTDVCPIAGDSVTFNATSTKDSVVDAAWTASGGSITGITLAAGYTGTLSLERSLTVSGTLSVASGTFTAGAQSADLHIVTISGGVFNASTGTMTISANFTHTAGGTFNHNSGTVVIDGPSGATWDVATTEDFHHLTFNSPSSSFATTIASGDTLNVNGTLTLTDGFFATGTIAAKGSTVSIGSAFGTGTNASGTLLINGSGAQTVTVAPQTDTTFEIADQFTLNNASATVTGTGASGRIGFDKVTVTAGLLNLDGYDATINEATSINGGALTFGGGTNVTTGTFALSSGTFNGGSGSLDANGAITISGGTYNATSGSMSLGANFTHTAGGTFNHQNGSIIIDAASTWDVATTEELFNLQINNSNNSFGNHTVTSGDTLNINGTLTLTDGWITGGTIASKGAVSVGPLFGAGTNANGTLLINGSGSQSITIAPQTDGTFEIADQFTLNNASATVTGTGTAGRIGFDKITVTLGTFNMDGYNMTAQEAVTVNGGIMSFGSGTHTLASSLALSSGTIHGGSGSLSVATTVTISGGTFNGDTVTSTFSGVFTLSGGTFNASTGTMTYASDWTHTAGGTFNHLGGTTQFTGANNSTINVASTEEFGAIILNKNNGINLVISSGDTITASGTLTLTEGRWFTGTLAAQGDVDVGANFDNTSVAASFIFSGGNVQTLTMGVLTKFSTGDVYINKSGGQVNLGGTWTMDSSNNDLIVQEGTLDLNGYNLTVTGAGTETFIIEDGGNLQLQGGETITGDSASYPQLNSGSTVTYDGASGPYTMKNYTYHHLAIAGGANSVFTQAANESYGGNVTITSGILSQGGFTTTVTGAFSNLGTLRRLQAETFTGTMDVDSGTVEYVGDGDGSVESVTVTDFGGTDYYNLKINDVNATKDTFTIGGGLVVAGALQVTSGTFQQGSQTISAAVLTVDGGTLTGGSASLSVSGAVTLSSGTLTATSNTFSVGGAWTHTAGGTFAPNGGTVQFTGNDATLDVDTSETFANVTVNKNTGQTLTITSGDSLLTTGTLALTDGAVGTGTLEAQGDVTVASTYDGGTATLKFTGGNAQAFALTGAEGLYNGPIVVEKSSNTVTLGSGLTLDHADADLTITLGTLNTSTHALATSAGSDIAVNGGVLTLGSSASHVLGGGLTVAGGTVNAGTSVTAFNGAFALSNGAFNGDTAEPTFSGALTISGGTFTAPSGTMQVAGGFTHTAGGTFAHNDGVVVFTGNSATIDVATTETFNGLTVNKTGGQTLTIASGDYLIALGTITLTNGAVSTGTLEARANVTVGSSYDGGNGPLTFVGGSSQSFDLTGATDKFNADIVVAKSGDTVSLASNLILDAVGQDLTVTSGTFSANTRNLTVAGNVAVNGGTLTLSSGTIDLNGNLAVGGGVLSMGSATVTLAGDATYTSGTMSPGTSSVTLDGTNQEITGGTTWYNLTKTVVAAATLTFPEAETTTVNGTLTLAGAASQLLSLRSSSLGVPAIIAPAVMTSPTYLDVRDITITLTTSCMISTQYCVNSGGNMGWTFMITSDDTPEPTPITLRVLSPNGGEVYDAAETIVITWTSTGRVDYVNVSISLDAGGSWILTNYRLSNVERVVYTLPETPTVDALVKVEGYDGVDVYVSDTSDATFTVAAETLEEVLPEVPTEDIVDDVYTPEEIAEVAERVAELPGIVRVHSLVKLPNDGDPATQHDATVYYISADGMRHAFPNEAVYMSWFCDFSGVQTITSQQMAQISFGNNVTYRPGAQMVKFVTNPKVYAVDAFGVLRWITSEALARALYGDAWARRIMDVSDAFFGNYSFGTPVTSADDFAPDTVRDETVYPSDSMRIPGYTGVNTSSASCGE